MMMIGIYFLFLEHEIIYMYIYAFQMPLNVYIDRMNQI